MTLPVSFDSEVSQTSAAIGCELRNRDTSAGRVHGGHMPKITVSYRREDSEAITGRLFDRLVARYGKASVFRDIDNIPPGVDFRTHIDEALGETDVLLVVIGRRWLGSAKPGHRRIQDAEDPV